MNTTIYSVFSAAACTPVCGSPALRWRCSAHCTTTTVTLTMAGGGWERFAADADETARVLGAKFVRPGLLPPDEAAALETGARRACQSGQHL